MAAGAWIREEFAARWKTDGFGVQYKIENFCRSLGVPMPAEAKPDPAPVPAGPTVPVPKPPSTAADELKLRRERENTEAKRKRKAAKPPVTMPTGVSPAEARKAVQAIIAGGTAPDELDDEDLFRAARVRRRKRHLREADIAWLKKAAVEAKRRDPNFRVGGAPSDDSYGGITR